MRKKGVDENEPQRGYGQDAGPAFAVQSPGEGEEGEEEGAREGREEVPPEGVGLEGS